MVVYRQASLFRALSRLVPQRNICQLLCLFYKGGPVSEIKVLFGASTGCTSLETVRPGISPCTLCICSYTNWLKKRAHTGCTPPKIVHPAVKMCAPGAGCTLNFGPCPGPIRVSHPGSPQGLGDSMYEMERGNLPPGSPPYSVQ